VPGEPRARGRRRPGDGRRLHRTIAGPLGGPGRDGARAGPPRLREHPRPGARGHRFRPRRHRCALRARRRGRHPDAAAGGEPPALGRRDLPVPELLHVADVRELPRVPLAPVPRRPRAVPVRDLVAHDLPRESRPRSRATPGSIREGRHRQLGSDPTPGHEQHRTHPTRVALAWLPRVASCHRLGAGRQQHARGARPLPLGAGEIGVAGGTDVPEFDYVTDAVVVGSGGGLCGAVTGAAAGLEMLVIEKESRLGGSTAISGGVLWLPNNPLMQDEGVADSFEAAMAYFDTVVGDAGPASSPERRAAYITEGANMVRFLQDDGMTFVRCEGYSDYYAGVRAIEGGAARGRSIEATIFDGRELGPWLAKLPTGLTPAVVLTGEAA